MIVTDELKRFKNVFNGDRRFIDSYRGFYPKKKNSDIKGKNIIVLDLKEKVEKLSVLICDIESLGKDVSKEREQLKDIIKVKSSVKMFSMLENMYTDLNNKYGSYISNKKSLLNIKNETSKNILESDLDSCIEFYLNELKTLKNDDNFVNDDFSKYVGDFYLVGYDLMMKEFLTKGESSLFDYFKESVHDINIVSEFIKLEVDSLWNSKTQIYGLNELDRVIDKESNYFNKNVIIQMLICMYPNWVQRFLKLRVQEFKNKLESVYDSIRNYSINYKNFKINSIKYISETHKLKGEYNEVLKEFQDFISSYCYFIDGEINDLKNEIKRMTLNIKYKYYD